MNIPSLNLLRGAILHSIATLKREDGTLFEIPIECAPYDSRKLHEVCINHKLAEHLKAAILPLLDCPQEMFVDIEFNREGITFKKVAVDGQDEKVRPDIIVHNRMSNGNKFNLLVVECKKNGADDADIQWDVKKIKVLMGDRRYEYFFGLQVIYGSPSVTGTLFYKNEDGSIKEEPINV